MATGIMNVPMMNKRKFSYLKTLAPAHCAIAQDIGGTMYRIVETDNFGGDYPNEKFVNLPAMINEHNARNLCNLINAIFSGDSSPRYWKVVDRDYKLQPGFEP
jgi:hypothetical protein